MLYVLKSKRTNGETIHSRNYENNKRNAHCFSRCDKLSRERKDKESGRSSLNVALENKSDISGTGISMVVLESIRFVV